MKKRRDVFVCAERNPDGTISKRSEALLVPALQITSRTGGEVYRFFGCADGALTELMRTRQPCAVLFAASADNTVTAAHLAQVLPAAVITDVEEVKALAKSKQLVWKKTSFGGYVASEVTAAKDVIQIGLIRPGAYTAGEEERRAAENIREFSAVDDQKRRDEPVLIKSRLKPEVNLEDAEVIVAGGRGAGGPEGFQLISQLADALGAQVAASRVAVDAGWAPKSSLVGQSGKRVRPKLYINCGISGSVQHITGMRDAGCIVSINSDPKALIFNVSDYCIVGDMFQILPSLIAQVNERRNINL